MISHHATAYTLGWIRNHAEDIESFVFHTCPSLDAASLRFRQAADHFYHLPGDVPFSARFIKSLGLDVLVFPDIGNYGENFQYAGMRLAPVQCTGWGQPVTSGLPTIDYYLSSELMEPENGDEHYRESLVRLPGSGLFWPRELPRPSGKSRSELGLPDGPFVLVCQNLRKLAPKWDFLIAEVQVRTGLPVVLIDYGVEVATDVTRERLSNLGIKTIWLPSQSQPDFLRIQQLAAVSLDSPAWNGGNTTVNSLGVGAPIVTLPGPFMRSRHSLAFLQQAKLDGLIASSPEQFVDLAADFDRLAKIMKGLDMSGVLEDHRVPIAVDEFLRSVAGRG
jgi:predicted O-linked N-acetylglucosamine transferase (SPINDLY family)